jgi:hypothetical protein
MAAPVYPRDGSGLPIIDPNWGFLSTANPGNFAGGTSNARGNYNGTQTTETVAGTTTLYAVTGVVAVRFMAVVKTTLTGATATVAVGTTGNTGGLIAATTGTTLTAGLLWASTSPATVIANTVPAWQIVSGNILETLATANVTAGNLQYICRWVPVSSDGFVQSNF